MKKLLLLTAAIVAIPAPAFAADDANMLDAFVSASVGYQNNGDNDGIPSEYENNDIAFALRGSAAVPLSSSVGVQADVSYSQDPLVSLMSPADTTLKSTDVAAHLFYRNPGKFLVGVIGQANFNSFSTFPYDYDTKQYFIGGEAQAYLNNVTLYGQVAYRNDEFGFPGANMDGIAATAQAKYFIDSNWSLALKGEYSSVKFDGEDYDIDQWRIGLGTERRLSSVPVSLLAKLDYGEDKFDGGPFDGLKLNSTRFMVGVKINFGSHTLEERDHAGASLDPFEVKNEQFPIMY